MDTYSAPNGGGYHSTHDSKTLIYSDHLWTKKEDRAEDKQSWSHPKQEEEK